MIQSVFDWLRSWPVLGRLKLERLDPDPGDAGLFCQGRTVLWQRRDILGRKQLRQRLEFLLSVHTLDPEDLEKFLLLEDFTDTAPVLGMDQTVSVTQGRAVRSDGQGILRCQAKITFEFTKEVE